MGIPEERMKRVGFGAKLETQRSVKRSPPTETTKLDTDGDFPKVENTLRSPVSSASTTDSDDSVEVRVRSPLHPKFRKRPLSPVKQERSSPSAWVKSESDSPAGPKASEKEDQDSFVVPKKKFRRTYEAEAQREDREPTDRDSDSEGRGAASPVPGCGRHSSQVVFECAGCLEAVARRFGWPAHALRSPAAVRSPVPPHLAAALPAFLAPQYGLPLTPYMDPLLTYQALQRDPRLALLPGMFASPLSRTPITPDPDVKPPSGQKPPVPAAKTLDDAPLDLTQRPETSRTSNTTSSSSNKFSIENILAGRTAPERTSTVTVTPPLQRLPGVPVSPTATSCPSQPPSRPQKPSPVRRGTSSSLQANERRELANERERMRVKHLTGAFKDLSNSISGIASECIGTSGVKFTKVAILRTASLYIGYLSHLLSEGPGETEENVYEHMRRAILEVMTAKSKKGREDDEEEDIDDI